MPGIMKIASYRVGVEKLRDGLEVCVEFGKDGKAPRGKDGG